MSANSAGELSELKHLLGLVEIEMSLLGSSTSHMAHWLGREMSVQFARETLHWGRGKSVVADIANLAQHLTRLAELLPKVESEQNAATADVANLGLSSQTPHE